MLASSVSFPSLCLPLEKSFNLLSPYPAESEAGADFGDVFHGDTTEVEQDV